MTLSLRDIWITEIISFACFTSLNDIWTCFRCLFTDLDDEILIELMSLIGLMSVEDRRIDRVEEFFIDLNLIKLRWLTFRNNEELSLQKIFIIWLSSLFICLFFLSFALLQVFSAHFSTTSRFMILSTSQWSLIHVTHWCYECVESE